MQLLCCGPNFAKRMSDNFVHSTLDFITISVKILDTHNDLLVSVSCMVCVMATNDNQILEILCRA